ncbi:hypothetical protein LJC74_06925 [Eubacteriales bacterium OttesenSCG-928-A19]|nr:hypothetical protein [Eubacteriales bacterium OttesenSCG-928-A19]
MKVHANSAPPGAFLVEDHPQRPGYAHIRLYENARPVESEAGWEYDEYILAIPRRPELVAHIEENYDAWLQTARAMDADYGAMQRAEAAVGAELCGLAERIIDLEIANAFLEMGVDLNAV